MSVHLDEARPRLADERQALAGVPPPQHRRTIEGRSSGDDRPTEPTAASRVADPQWAPPLVEVPRLDGSLRSPRRRSAMAAAAVGACLAVIAGVLVLSGTDAGDEQVATEGTTSSTAPIEPVDGAVPVTTADVVGEQPATEPSAAATAATETTETETTDGDGNETEETENPAASTTSDTVAPSSVDPVSSTAASDIGGTAETAAAPPTPVPAVKNGPGSNSLSADPVVPPPPLATAPDPAGSPSPGAGGSDVDLPAVAAPSPSPPAPAPPATTGSPASSSTSAPATTRPVTTQPAAETTQPATTQPLTTQPETTRPAVTQPAPTTRPAPITTVPTTTVPTTTAPTTTAPPTTSPPARGGAIIWQDNFDSLDRSRWALEHSTYGDGNNEVQCYRPENVSVSGGRLILRAVSETYTCPNGSTRQATSGMIRSRGVRFEPGQAIEFRVRLTPADPANQGGLWPAVWSSGWAGGGWPRGGELDYLEVMTATDPTRSIYSMHYAKPNGSHGVTNRPVFGAENFSGSWHTVRFEYGANGVLTWFLDGRQVQRVDAAQTLQGYPAPFDQAIGEIKINMALGGRPGPLDPRALGSNGATFEVDYIRVVQL